MWKTSPFLWAGDAYLYQALGNAYDQFFSWEEGLGPFRCYFYDLVYYVLCLGKGFGCFLHDFGKQSCFLFIAAVSGLCRPWKTIFRLLSGLGCSVFFLESAALVWENGTGLKIRGIVT